MLFLSDERDYVMATETQTAPADFGKQLQAQTTGCRLTTFSLSLRRTMPKGAVNQVADLFSAEAKSLSGSRAIVNRKHELVKPVLATLRKAKDFVNAYSIDYPEKGVRLVKIANISWMNETVEQYRSELAAALAELDAGWETVKADAQERLGELYDESDYPASPSSGYGLELSFPAIKPDDRLAQLHPELYAQEQARIIARFDDAVKTAEATAADELALMLEHLIERLAPDETGATKKLHESTVDNLTEFAKRFKSISIGSNTDLDRLVAEVEAAAGGIDVKELRKSDEGSKALLQAKFAELRASVDKLVIARPGRDIDLD